MSGYQSFQPHGVSLSKSVENSHFQVYASRPLVGATGPAVGPSVRSAVRPAMLHGMPHGSTPSVYPSLENPLFEFYASCEAKPPKTGGTETITEVALDAQTCQGSVTSVTEDISLPAALDAAPAVLNVPCRNSFSLAVGKVPEPSTTVI